jgi:hypothetical protein
MSSPTNKRQNICNLPKNLECFNRKKKNCVIFFEIIIKFGLISNGQRRGLISLRTTVFYPSLSYSNLI